MRLYEQYKMKSLKEDHFDVDKFNEDIKKRSGTKIKMPIPDIGRNKRQYYNYGKNGKSQC